MEKVCVYFVILICIAGFVFAGEWGDIKSNESVTSEEEVGVDKIDKEAKSGGNFSDKDCVGDSSGDTDCVSSSGAEFVYTDNFYLALAVGGVGVLIVLLLLYLFFRSPKNRWKD